MPKGHATQSDSASLPVALDVPVGQATQSDAASLPVELEYLPAAQAVQTDDPADAAYVPAPHAQHSSPAPMEPAAHAEQAFVSIVRAEPGLHGCTTVPPTDAVDVGEN